MKQHYQSPHIEIIEVENEGVMANSPLGNVGGYDGKHEMFSAGTGRSSSSNVRRASALQDLEDALNDIFTVSK